MHSFEAPAQSTPRVVVVDDDPLALAVVQRLLTRSGYDVVTCDDARGGLLKMRQAATFALIADLHLPGSSGLELLRSARELSPTTFRLLYTGESQRSVLARAATEQVVHAIVLKSEGFEVLTETLARLHRTSDFAGRGARGMPRARSED